MLLSAVAGLLIVIAVYYSWTASRYKRQLSRANLAEADAREKLFRSSVAQARASRSSRRPGQRFAALRALAEAAKIHRTPELRDEAIACLALPDMELSRRWSGADWACCLDPSFELFATTTRDGTIGIRRVGDGGEVQRIDPPGRTAMGYILAFSPDGLYLAAGHFLSNRGDQSVRVYRIGRREPVVIDPGPVIDASARLQPGRAPDRHRPRGRDRPALRPGHGPGRADLERGAPPAPSPVLPRWAADGHLARR